MLNVTSTKKRLSATVYYLLTGLAVSWPGFLLTGLLLPKWQHGSSLSPLSLVTIHWIILGFMLTVAYGVLYQIVPIAFRTAPVPRNVLYWHLPIHLIAFLTMVTGFLVSRYIVVGIGGTLLLCNAGIYLTLIGKRYMSAQNKTPVHRALFVPFIALFSVMLVGLFQAFYPGLVTESVLLTHVLLGGLGFWGGLIIVFSYKLFPMFAISHGYKASLARTAVLYFVGILGLITSAWLPVGAWLQTIRIIASVLVLSGLASFSVDILAVLRARKRRRIVLPLYDSLLAMFWFVLGHVGILAAVFLGSQRGLFTAIYVLTFGGFIGLMLAYMQKMVPFLWFEYRFSKRPERKTAPLIDDMVPKSSAQAGIIIYHCGVILGALQLGLPTSASGLSWISAGCLTFGSLLLFISLRYVLTIGGTRPADDPVN